MDNPVSKHLADQFEAMVDWVNGSINPLTNEDLKMELSPGKNHGIWLLGHLVVCDDDFSLYMGKGELLYPEIYEIFGYGSKPLPPEEYWPAEKLRECWKKVCEKNRKIYSELTDAELKEQHAKVEDIEKDYFKTKERICTYWQLHQMYHAGQLGILVSRAGKSKY